LNQLSIFDLMRVWAAVTGLVLVAGFFAAPYLGIVASPLLPLLVAAIGGFELFLFSQDIWLKRRRTRG
jgi:zinc transporter ZupT